MAATATSLASALREQWTDDELQKQWFSDDSPLSRVEQFTANMIGKQAQVPIWGDLSSGGYTSTSAAGGNLNTAKNQSPQQAVYTLTQHFFPIGLEFSALNQASGNNLQSVVGAKDMEVQGALAALRGQCTRQLVTNGDGIVAQAGTSGGSSTTLPLVASPSGTAYGYDAMVREWLRPNLTVDVGTTADTDALATAANVDAISESATAPTITLSTAVDATAGTHFVYIANPNSATAANPELNGLRNIVSTTGALGGLNPATAGQEFWQATTRDTSTTVLSLDLMLNLARGTKQKTGGGVTDVWASLKQQQNFYSLLQNQVRFSGDRQIEAGGVESASWNGMKLTGWNSVLDSDIWFLNLKDFVRVTGAIKKPTWMSQLQGTTQGQIWAQGTTGFVDALAYAFQIGVRRRNSLAGATGLTA